MEDLIAVLPFGGTFDLVQMNGSTLREVFEHSVRRYGGSTGEFLQVSGTFTLGNSCKLFISELEFPLNLSTGIPWTNVAKLSK